VPYWPVQSTWTYKEIWGHPTGRWIWLMRNLYGPSLVEGPAAATVICKEVVTGQEFTAEPDPVTGQFRIMLPEGKYSVRSAAAPSAVSPAATSPALTRTFLPGETYHLDLRPGKSIDVEVTSTTSKGRVMIKVAVSGSGAHHLSIRTDNLALSGARKELTILPGHKTSIEWQATIVSKDEPWVAVVIPDDDFSQRRELNSF
jgi:hypothetical protein